MENRKTCPNCGASNIENAAYCEQCGTLLLQPKQPKEKSVSTSAQDAAGQTTESLPQENGVPAAEEPQQTENPQKPTEQPFDKSQPEDTAPEKNQPPQSYTYGNPAGNGAPQNARPPYQPDNSYGQDASRGEQPYQPSYAYGGQPRYGRPFPHVPRYPFGQVGRMFGWFDGVFEPGSMTPIRSRTAAAVLCLLLGPFGVHKFYTGQWGWGIVSLFLLITLGWTGWIWGIAYAVAIAEAILLFTMSDSEFQDRYHVRPM